MVLRLPYWSANMGISLCMIVRNEEDWVEGAVQSVRSIVNEVIIVDTGPTDATLERLKPVRKFYERALESDSNFREPALELAVLYIQGVSRMSRAISGIGNAPMNPEKGNVSASPRVLAELEQTPFLENEVRAVKGQ